MSYKFNSFLISKQDERKLRKSDDLFDLAILACLYIIRTRDDMEKRLFYKKKLHKLALEKNFSLVEMEKILIFVEEILQLPEPIEIKFKKHLRFKEKKLETMEMTQNSKEMFAAMFQGMFGINPETMHKKQAKAEQQVAKSARLVEKERFEKEKERLEKEKVQAQLILLLYVQTHLPVEKIAEDYDIDLKKVEEVVEKYLETNNLAKNISTPDTFGTEGGDN